MTTEVQRTEEEQNKKRGGNPRQLPSGRWVTRFPAPSRHRKTFDTQKQAKAALDEARHLRNQGLFLAPKAVPRFREAAEEWLSGKSKKRPATLAAWRGQLDRYLLPAFGDLKIDRIGVAAIERLRDQLQLPPANLRPVSTNKILGTCNAIFKLALRRGYCLNNPVAIAERADSGSSKELTEDADQPQSEAHAEVRPDEVLNPAEIRRLFEASDDGYYRTLFMTASGTGMRIGELLALRWSDVELDAQKIHVRRSLSWARVQGEPVKPRFYPPKTRAGTRTVPIAAELAATLKVWKLRCPPNDHDLIFPAPDGRPAHRTNVMRQGLLPALRRAKLRKVTLHSLRHSFASILITNNAPITEVAGLLGHSSPTVTLGIYSHWLRGVKTDSINLLSKALFRGDGAPGDPHSNRGAGHQMDTNASAG